MHRHRARRSRASRCWARDAEHLGHDAFVGQACEQRALAGEMNAGTPFVAQQLGKGGKAPIVAATDYVRALPESVRAFLPEGRRYLTLGTDGFGRSDTRAALRGFFGVDAASIARAARHALGA
eukprot:Opistho-1_new@46654